MQAEKLMVPKNEKRNTIIPWSWRVSCPSPGIVLDTLSEMLR